MFFKGTGLKEEERGRCGFEVCQCEDWWMEQDARREGSSAHKCALSFPGVKSVFRCRDLHSEKHGSRGELWIMDLKSSREPRSVIYPKL